MTVLLGVLGVTHGPVIFGLPWDDVFLDRSRAAASMASSWSSSPAESFLVFEGVDEILVDRSVEDFV